MTEEKINGGVLVRSAATSCKTNRQIQCNHPDIAEHKIQLGDEWTCGECGQPWRISIDKMGANNLYWRRAKVKKEKISVEPG